MCSLQEPSRAWPGCSCRIWVIQTAGWKDITTLIFHPPWYLSYANLWGSFVEVSGEHSVHLGSNAVSNSVPNSLGVFSQKILWWVPKHVYSYIKWLQVVQSIYFNNFIPSVEFLSFPLVWCVKFENFVWIFISKNWIYLIALMLPESFSTQLT